MMYLYIHTSDFSKNGLRHFLALTPLIIRFAKVCSHEDYFNARNKCFTAKLLKQG